MFRGNKVSPALRKHMKRIIQDEMERRGQEKAEERTAKAKGSAPRPKAKGPAAKASASSTDSKPEASKADIDRLLANAETLAWPAFWEVLSKFQQMQDSEAEAAEYKGKLYNEDAMRAVEKGLNVILRKKHK